MWCAKITKCCREFQRKEMFEEKLLGNWGWNLKLTTQRGTSIACLPVGGFYFDGFFGEILLTSADLITYMAKELAALVTNIYVYSY